MSEWRRVLLEKVVRSDRGITYGIVQPGPDVRPNGIPLIRGMDYSGGSISPDDLYHVLPEIDAPYSRSRVNSGDILLSIVGNVGLIAMVPESLQGANITQTTARLSVDRERFDHEFVFHSVKSEAFQADVRRFVKGSAQPGLNLSDVKRLSFIAPHERSTQHTIARILGTIDSVIAETEALIDKQQQIKQGMLYDLFTRGVNANGQLRPPQTEAPELYSETKLGWTPIEWKVDSLGAVAEFKAGHAFRTSELSEMGTRVVRITNLHREDFPFWFYDKRMAKDCGVTRGDLLFSWAGVASSIDAYWYDGPDAYLNQHIYNFKVPDTDYKRFLFHFLQFRLPKLRQEIEGGAGQLHLSKSKIQAIPVLKPEPRELLRLNAILDGATQTLEEEVEHRKKLVQLKAGLMQDLLTGRVPVDHLVESMNQQVATIADPN